MTAIASQLDRSTATATAGAVRCRAVTKSYGRGDAKVTALRGIDLDVKAGELMMLVGPSGCGKTTLISVIAGVLDRDGGECSVFGPDFATMTSREKTRYRGETIGFVFQAFNLLPTLTAAENAAIPLLINGAARSSAIAKAKDMLALVGLGDRVKALPAELSGGQQQRVAIARALVHEPDLIVCDEPTSALDHDTGHRVMEMLKQIALKEDRALVIVTHDARIFSFADRIAKMDDGRIVRVVDDHAKIDAMSENGNGGGGNATQSTTAASEANHVQ
jgi:putative ABC transport system ATP-binding protein